MDLNPFYMRALAKQAALFYKDQGMARLPFATRQR
jgi:hypothetical protein